MSIQMIVAMTPERVIGRNNELPWNIPSDLARFRRITMGHALIMGANTFFGILKKLHRPLDGRENIVVTRSRASEIEKRGGIPMSSPHEALRFVEERNKTAFVMGGASIYEALLPHAKQLHITTVFPPAGEKIEGDSYFPEIPNLNQWHPWSQSLRRKWGQHDEFETDYHHRIRP